VLVNEEHDSTTAPLHLPVLELTPVLTKYWPLPASNKLPRLTTAVKLDLTLHNTSARERTPLSPHTRWGKWGSINPR
jgi:hypothetical protein